MIRAEIGETYLLNVHSSKCLGLEGTPANGARVIQWQCNGNDDQIWRWSFRA